jgi:energy-coupling factor transport system substrate-specific component
MTQPIGNRWRTVDIVVASIIAVAFGVVFWAWGLLWFGPWESAFAFYPPAAGLINGVWFVPAVLVPLIIRKVGGGVFAEVVAAFVSALLGSGWGWTTLWYGLIQGVGGELGFAPFGYRKFGLGNALLGGALAGAGATILDLTVSSYGDLIVSQQLAYGAVQIISGALIAGAGSWLLVQALAKTGVLDRFAAGRNRELV